MKKGKKEEERIPQKNTQVGGEGGWLVLGSDEIFSKYSQQERVQRGKGPRGRRRRRRRRRKGEGRRRRKKGRRNWSVLGVKEEE